MYIWILCVLLLVAHPAQADFRNSMTLLGNAHFPGGDQQYVDYAKAWGYEWVTSDPWGITKSVLAVNAGLKVSMNLNANRGAKWYAFENPGTPAAPQNPTRMNSGTGYVAITAQQYQDFKVALCMTNGGLSMGDTELYNPTTKAWKYRTYVIGGNIVFYANLYVNAAVDRNVAAILNARRVQETAAGKTLYHGIFFDETNLTVYPENGFAPGCANPINGGIGAANSGSFGGVANGNQTHYTAYQNGRRRLIRGVHDAFEAALGGAFEGMSGNANTAPYYDPEQEDPDLFLKLVHLESSGGETCDSLTELENGSAFGCGTNDIRTYGVVLPENVQVQLGGSNFACSTPLHFEDSYRGAQLIMGRAASHGEWGGWFGQICPPLARPSVHLLRAVPHWDNMANATSRVWNETGVNADTYTSSNSRIDNNIVYSRHRLYNANHKLYVARNSGSPSITLNSNERVVTAKCTNSLFFETSTCVSGYFTQTGTTVTLGGSIQNGNGYILTVHRQPTIAVASTAVADQLEVDILSDDLPTPIEPASGSITGFIVKVVGVTRTPTSITRTGAGRYHFVFNTGTISGGQAVTVEYSGGNVTSGTAMINTSAKVPMANTTVPVSAQNTIGGTGGGTPVLSETGYQWQSVEGSADDAPLYGTANVQLVPSPGGRARLIIKFRNTVNAHVATVLPLYFVVDPADITNPNQGVPVTDSCEAAAVCYTAATGIGSYLPTTEFLPSAETNDVPCGVIDSAANVPILTMPAASETECIYSLKFNDLLTATQKVYFIPRQTGNTLLNGYTTSNLPHATVAAPRSDRKGSITGGTVR